MIITISMREPYVIVPVLYEKLGSCSNNGRFVVKVKPSHYGIKERVLKAYSQVPNRLLKTYTPDYIIAETDSGIARFLKHSTMSQLEFSNELWMETMRCPHI